jgi:hypothetical protein
MLEFFLLLTFGAVLATLALSRIERACQYAPTESTQPADQDYSNLSILINPQPAAQRDTRPNERQSQWQQESWWGKFWCDIKASDVAVAFFTYALFVVGWLTVRNGTRLARELERAYVSGGGPWMIHAPPLFPQIIGFQLTADNYGKSPATIIGYAVEICDLNHLPKTPRYTRTPLRNTLRPQETGLFIAQRLITTPIPTPVAYGRVWYRDIWKKQHYFSFILTTDSTDHSSISHVHKAYTDWT